MTDDLTPILLRARERSEMWSKDKVLETARLVLSLYNKARLHWDRGAGESWATIKNDEIMAIIIEYFPLAIVFPPYSSTLQPLLEANKITVVVARDWNTRMYSLDPTTIEIIFPHGHWDTSVINPQQFSIGDLWYATI
jgi:hypothetical protein